MTESVLIVDDDTLLLRAYERRFRGRFQFECVTGGNEGLIACRERGPFAVVVSDRQMPGMDGVEFLARLRELYPDTIRIMLTGMGTLETTVDAVNTGQIFRFLLKPCQFDSLGLAIEAGMAQHRLMTAERELLTKTLSGSVKMLTDVLSLINPTAFGRSSRIRRLVRRLIDELHVEQAWPCELAAMLCLVGCVTVSPATLAKAYGNAELSEEELRAFNAHPAVGHDLIANIPRLHDVAEIIAFQNKRFDGVGLPHDSRQGKRIPLGARILKVALDFDTLSSAHGNEADAFAEMAERSNWYDPSVIDALQRTLHVALPYHVQSFSIAALPDNAVFADDVCNRAGRLLIAKGNEVTAQLRELLRINEATGGVPQPIRVLMPAQSFVDRESGELAHC